MADRIVILRDGVIAQQGTPMELYGQPADRFVAGFIGAPTMNFLKGRTETTGGVAACRFGDGDVVPLGAGAPEAGREVVAGIRPENLRIGPQEAGKSGLRGRITLVEPTGPSDYLVVGTNAGEVTIVAESGAARVGEAVNLVANPGDWHLFEPGENGRRIAA